MPTLVYVVAIGIEAFGGVLLVLGHKSRLAAAVLALYCVATALSFHAHLADICMAGGLVLQIVAFGAGSLSIDGHRAGNHSGNVAVVNLSWQWRAMAVICNGIPRSLLKADNPCSSRARGSTPMAVRSQVAVRARASRASLGLRAPGR